MVQRARRRSNRRSTGRPKRIVRLSPEYFAAIELGDIIFPALYQFENGLRLLLNGFLETCYGADWWNVSLRPKLPKIFEYAETQQKRLDAMPWIGSSSAVKVLPVHLITLGHLEEIVKAYRSDCIPELFPILEFFLGHMELIKRVRNMYTHMFPCITRRDCQFAKNEILILAHHINSKLR